MRYAAVLVSLCSLITIVGSIRSANQSAVDSLEVDVPPSQLVSQARRERKERRLLRKKKQRMRELREEIRALTLSLHQTPDTPPQGKGEQKHKRKDRRDHKGVKWRKNLLEKLKVIVHRLDRMERRILGVKPYLTNKAENSTASVTISTTAAKTSHNSTQDLKIRRIQPAITRSRSGENGTVCTAHKDCRPGHCCHHFITKEKDNTICVMHALTENIPCIDGCQCSTQLSCFLPDSNLTEAFCKKASSIDVLEGTYLYRQDSTIIDV
ncbi:unnamed protein product [Cylicocyclus nassatus]|uniref:Uncharacterized protein n=1 Tax=Cylicocyclus nassatus TaxID=53992 RepID=A0AA36HE24_CYLNA|nr:unnamed protein product [Cylicocyclus nassatus]